MIWRSGDLAKLVTFPSDAYAAWAPTYPPYAHNSLMDVEQTAVLELLPPVSGRTVLDAGCGTGRYMRLLTALGARVVGVDLSAAMASRAHALNLAVALADMAALPLAGGVLRCRRVGPGDSRRFTARWRAASSGGGCSRTAESWCIRRSIRSGALWDGSARTNRARAHARCRRTGTPCAEHHDACVRAGLDIETVSEPGLTRGGPPVALVIRARRHR